MRYDDRAGWADGGGYGVGRAFELLKGTERLMRTIWKFPIEVRDIQGLNMPSGATILTVQVQHNDPCLWAIVDPSEVTELRTFRIVGTGHPIDFTTEAYIGTFQLSNGGLVFHIFEVIREGA